MIRVNTMNRKKSSHIFVVLSLAALLIVSMAVAGCTGQWIENTRSNTGSHRCRNFSNTCIRYQPPAAPVMTTAPVSTGQRQTIKISGSTTVLPIVQKAADQYMASHPDADIQVSGGGSGVGIQAIGAKTVDIGMSSREVTKDEMTKYPAFCCYFCCSGWNCSHCEPGKRDPVHHARSGQGHLPWQNHEVDPDYRCERSQAPTTRS